MYICFLSWVLSLHHQPPLWTRSRKFPLSTIVPLACRKCVSSARATVTLMISTCWLSSLVCSIILQERTVILAVVQQNGHKYADYYCHILILSSCWATKASFVNVSKRNSFTCMWDQLNHFHFWLVSPSLNCVNGPAKCTEMCELQPSHYLTITGLGVIIPRSLNSFDLTE